LGETWAKIEGKSSVGKSSASAHFEAMHFEHKIYANLRRATV
jgi:uncharacterized protein (DUF736 family)